MLPCFLFYFLGTDFKNIACGVLGILLCLKIRREKEAMKTKEFNASIGATAGCTMRLAQLAAPVKEGEEKPLVEGDAWFGSVTCAVELAQHHYGCVLQIKTNSSLFPKAYIETALENAPGCCKIVLTASPQGIPLVAIGYRYSTRTTLLFVSTKNAGSARP
jgi:hypothetical protein